MEELMYYVWQQRMFLSVKTTDDSEIEIINPGLRNLETGPDFFNAKIRIDGTLWAGNVEMHVRASDWVRHRHDQDHAYDSVILHVVLDNDMQVNLPNGEELRTVVMQIPEALMQKYEALTTKSEINATPIACSDDLQELPAIVLHDWETSLAVQRMMDKVQRVRDLIEDNMESWPAAFYVILCRAFGTGTNSDPCERLARSLPFEYIRKHLDNPLQIEALLLGQGGWLSEQRPADEIYYHQLQREYAFLRAKFSLTPLPQLAWKFSRTRPQANPQARMAMLAALLCQKPNLFSEILETPTIDKMLDLLKVSPSEFWREHYVLNGPRYTDPHPYGLGLATRQSLIINAIIPILLAYGQWQGNEELSERSMTMLENIPAEHNRYTEYWAEAGVPIENSLESQALLHLFKNYCQLHKCMRCRIGCWLLKSIRI